MYSSTSQMHAPPAPTPKCNHAFMKGKHMLPPNTYFPI